MLMLFIHLFSKLYQIYENFPFTLIDMGNIISIIIFVSYKICSQYLNLHTVDFHALLSVMYRYSNISSVEHRRMRRGLKEIASRIWKGFTFNLATPSKDWQKKIGGKSLGASFGLVFKNALNIKIGKRLLL